MPSILRYGTIAAGMARDLARWPKGRPTSVETYLGLRAAHRATAGWSSKALASTMAAVPGTVDHLSRGRRPPLPTDMAAALAELRRDGVAVLPPLLTPEAVASLREFASTAPARIRHSDGRVTAGAWVDRPEDAAAVFVDGAFGWARPEVQHLLSDPRLHALGAHVTGMHPIVHPPQLYWTVASPSAEADADPNLARHLHWDYDGVAGIRVHVYLTDVDEHAGPMQYAAGTHRPGSLGWHRPTSAADTSTTVTTDPARWTMPTGPAGTTFATNPHGLHRALRPTERSRLFLVVAVQGGSFGGHYRHQRAVPVRDDRFGALLAAGDPALRLWVAADAGTRTAAMASTAG